MATKFYLSSNATGSLNPSFSSFWTDTSQADRRVMSTGKTSSNLIDKTVSINSYLSGSKTLIRQYVSQPLKGGIYIGSVNGQLVTKEYNDSNNCYGAMFVKVVNSSGNLAGNFYSGISSTEYRSSKTNQFAPPTGNCTTVNVGTGGTWYLVVEYGVACNVSGVTGVINTFGDNQINNLPENQTLSGATLTGYNPWINFTNNFKFW